jgi:WD40 repeat protein
MAQIFISHSSTDKEQADALQSWLHAQGFLYTFLDFDKDTGIGAGDEWERTLYRQLAAADAVILILTEHWMASKWCFAEFTQARALGKSVIPLIETPTGGQFFASDLQYLDLVKDRDGALNRLRSKITEITLNTRGGFAWDNTRSPYPGLLAFDEADAPIYFGRDDDIRRLIERLNARRAQGGEKLVLVLGASGSGKSSLLRAGLVPRLKRDQHNWIVLPTFRPQVYPLDELAQSIAQALGTPAAWKDWRAAFAAEDLRHTFFDLFRDLRAANRQNEAQILLVIDQGEEFFSGSDAAQTSGFFRVLNALLDPRLPFLAVMSLRSDYLGRLQQQPELEAAFEQFSLKPMPLDRVREIIEGPAKVANFAVDEALITAAIADARTEDALPLLAFALRELYDTAGSGHLTVQAYRALGDAHAHLSPLENAVRRKADEVLASAKPAPEDLQALKEAFIPAMVRVNPEGEYVRRPASMSALPPRALPLIESLARARLLTVVSEDGETTVEVTHEALLRKWPLLHGWLDEEREFIIGKDQLERDLLEYKRTPPSQQTEALLTGLKLTRARAWLVSKKRQLSQPECEFIQASIRRQEAAAAQKEKSRLLILRATIAVAIVLAALAAEAFWQFHEARVSESYAISRQLAGKSITDQGTDDVEALKEAIAAAGRAPTEGALQALNQALARPHEKFIFHFPKAVHNAEFSPDGASILTSDFSNTAILWNFADGHKVATLSHRSGNINDAIFSPDGRYVLTVGDNSIANLWNAVDGKWIEALAGHSGSIRTAAFSQDSKFVVTGGDDKTARVWSFSGIASAAAPVTLGPLQGPFDQVTALAIFAKANGEGRVAVGTSGGTMQVFDLKTAKALSPLRSAGDAGQVFNLHFSPDGTRIASATSRNAGCVWDTETGKCVAPLQGAKGAFWDVVFSPDGKQVLAPTGGGNATIFDAASGAVITTLIGHSDLVRTARFSTDGKQIVTSSLDRTVRLWDASGRALGVLSGDTSLVTDARFSQDGTAIIAAGKDKTARVWSLLDARVVAPLANSPAVLTSAEYSADGARLVACFDKTTVLLFEAATGRLIARSTAPAPLKEVHIAPDGKHVLTLDEGSYQEKGSSKARLWLPQTNSWIVLNGDPDPLQTFSASFSPDGSQIATANRGGTVRLFRTTDGGFVRKLPATPPADAGSGLSFAVFSPNAQRILATSTNGLAYVWDISDGRLLATLNASNKNALTKEVTCGAFSPDGKTIVTGGEDTSVRVWSAAGSLLKTLAGHTDTVTSIAFSAAGDQLLTTSDEQTILWDAHTFLPIRRFDSPHAGLQSARFIPSHQEIATFGLNMPTVVFDSTSGQPLANFSSEPGLGLAPDGKSIVTGGNNGIPGIFAIDFSAVLALARQQLPIEITSPN